MESTFKNPTNSESSGHQGRLLISDPIKDADVKGGSPKEKVYSRKGLGEMKTLSDFSFSKREMQSQRGYVIYLKSHRGSRRGCFCSSLSDPSRKFTFKKGSSGRL